MKNSSFFVALLFTLWLVFGSIVQSCAICRLRPFALSPDGNYIAVTASDVTYLFESMGQPIQIRNFGVDFISVSSGCDYIAYSLFNRGSVIRKDGTLVQEFEDMGGPIVLTSDGALVSFAKGKDAFIFSLKDNTFVWSYHPPEEREILWGAFLSPDGNYVGVVSLNNNIRIFDCRDNVLIWSYYIGYWATPIETWISFSSNGYIAVGTDEGVFLFDKEDNTPIWSHEGREISISADGRYIALGDFDSVSLFDFEENKMMWSYPLNSPMVAISADGKYIAAAVDGKYSYNPNVSSVYLFSRENGIPVWSYSFTPPPRRLDKKILVFVGIVVCVLMGTVTLFWTRKRKLKFKLRC